MDGAARRHQDGEGGSFLLQISAAGVICGVAAVTSLISAS